MVRDADRPRSGRVHALTARRIAALLPRPAQRSQLRTHPPTASAASASSSQGDRAIRRHNGRGAKRHELIACIWYGPRLSERTAGADESLTVADRGFPETLVLIRCGEPLVCRGCVAWAGLTAIQRGGKEETAQAGQHERQPLQRRATPRA